MAKSLVSFTDASSREFLVSHLRLLTLIAKIKFSRKFQRKILSSFIISQKYVGITEKYLFITEYVKHLDDPERDYDVSLFKRIGLENIFGPFESGLFTQVLLYVFVCSKATSAKGTVKCHQNNPKKCQR